MKYYALEPTTMILFSRSIYYDFGLDNIINWCQQQCYQPAIHYTITGLEVAVRFDFAGVNKIHTLQL